MSSISSVIAALVAQGRDAGVEVCPYCHGGTKQRRTLSVNLRDGIWLWLCHRAKCGEKGAMPGDPRGLLNHKPAEFTPRPLTAAYCLPTAPDPIVYRLYGDDKRPALIETAIHAFAAEHGLRVIESDPGTHAWAVKDFDGLRKGWITRDEDKRIRVWREKPGPFYAVFEAAGEDGPWVVVEDCLSAALLAEDGINSIALLGTNLQREAASEIATATKGRKLVVALDPDDAGRGSSFIVAARLRNAGAEAYIWPLEKDVNKMPVAERRELIRQLRTV